MIVNIKKQGELGHPPGHLRLRLGTRVLRERASFHGHERILCTQRTAADTKGRDGWKARGELAP
jgi:hypothetical protein